MNDRRLIEEVFPLGEVSAESVLEKNVRHGHISTIHIWWARRPLAACRAALLGALLREPDNEAERKKLLDLLVTFSKWEASTDPHLIQRARQLVIGNNGGQRPKILDCFAGGGAIPLEALRVGCDAYALELNPVAVLIELCTLVYPQKYGKKFEIEGQQKNLMGEQRRTIPNRLAFDIERWGKWVGQEVQREVGEFYPQDDKHIIPAAYIWARTVTCPNPNCAAKVPLLRQLWLARKPNRKIAMKLLPNPRTKKVDFEIVESKEIDFDPEIGTMRQGSSQCPVCQSSLTRNYLKDRSRAGQMGERLIAVVLSSTGGKKYRLAKPDDQKVFDRARVKLEKLKSEISTKMPPIPNEVISRDWPRTILLPLYGITIWGQIFNARQALTHITFVRKIEEAYRQIVDETRDKDYAKAVTTYLALVLDRIIDFTNSLCAWHPQWEFVAHTFARQAIPMTWDYAELVPFSPILSGTWNGMLGQILDTVNALGEVQWNEADVRQGTATRLPYDDSFFDAVITDPPYYSAVPYADLSDFFYVWLKRTVGPLYPELFSTPLTPKGPEIVEQMPHSSLVNRKDKAFFEREMTKALLEINRVVKPDGVIAIVFAHKTTTAWETLIAALLNAGFSVSSSWPLHTEMKERARAQKSAALASSVWLVCRKRRSGSGVGSWKLVQADLDQRVKERLDYFLEQGIKGADALLSAIGPALEVFGKYEKVEKVTGEIVSINEFLDKVREVVAHHALTTVLSERELGKLDPATAFYVLWKWTYEPRIPTMKNGNNILVPFDDALKLARSVGAEIDILLGPRGLLRQENENVHLLNPDDRRKISGLGETLRDGTPPTIIDMIHRVLILWSAQDQAKLGEFLKVSGAGTNETFRLVAQALSNLLPLQSREKQLLDGVLAKLAGGTSNFGHTPEVQTLDEYTGEGDKK